MTSIERVLVAFDGTTLSRKALEHALDVYPEASIRVLHVIDYVEESYSAKLLVGSEQLRERAHERSERLLEQAEEIANEKNRSISTTITIGSAPREIIEFADSHDIDVIVLGSHGRSGLSRVLLGSVADTVTRRASSAVCVVR
ncbi:universal stress protein UspA [Halodesulfurarchaeum formicicum]|uniref:Universal stress protein UspA n=1 Tax=Halodesulfurarchaeum formicicum TaxID=1873524 RepID=A0A1D8S4L6_9EURY|nr:universal stress protein [Halodesulfurarchaeum formicicum]AOW80298.1 universal stress protein UspA [Halodesulfurarchaeum formicicum]